jgi:hypothetical protein
VAVERPVADDEIGRMGRGGGAQSNLRIRGAEAPGTGGRAGRH